jgi:thiosulfate/3-mercaptopyruvate sulfurtransferase
MDHPSPLISAEALRVRVGDPRLRLADVRWTLGRPDRGRDAYARGHLPGAVFLDLEQDLSAPDGPGRHPLPDPAVLAQRLGALGLGDGHSIVAYDDASGTVAARLWWMLDRLGHRDVAVLDGGLPAWLAIGGELTTEVPSLPRARLTLATGWTGTLERADLERRLGRLDLVDLRAAERYRGEVEPVDRVPGHIPTARSLPSATLIGEDGRLLPPGALGDRLTSVAAEERDGPTVLSCGSGVTACLGALAARVAGLPDPLLYPGSYSDWSAAEMPVATGHLPGSWRGPRSPES